MTASTTDAERTLDKILEYNENHGKHSRKEKLGEFCNLIYSYPSSNQNWQVI